MSADPLGHDRDDNRVFVPQWDVRENDRSFQPPSVARKIIQGLLLPIDKTLVCDLMETYNKEGEFVDFFYGWMKEVPGFNLCYLIVVDSFVFLLY